MAMITGCGHGGVLNLLNYARQTFRVATAFMRFTVACTFHPWKIGTSHAIKSLRP